MQASRYHLLRLLLPLVLFITACPPCASPVGDNLANRSVGFTILGEISHLAPDSRGSFVLQVRDPKTEEPLPNARVQVALNVPDGQLQTVFQGDTDDRGVVPVSFEVPEQVEEPDQILSIMATTITQTLRYEEPVYVGRAYNILLSTDKPVYQPGQTIHLRSLALDTTALGAARSEPLVLTIADPDGNKLMRRELTTSDYGIAAADFILDTQAPSGDYLITAEMGPVNTSRSVEVKPYSLPRFEITVSGERSYYAPGEIVTGTVEARYYFGKPVRRGQVDLRGFVTDVERVEVLSVQGETDDTGRAVFSFRLPEPFVALADHATAELDLEISVTDGTNHVEQIEETLTVAENPILIDVVPESGVLRPGVENRVYLQTSYPDGQAVATTITVTGALVTPTLVLNTDEFGLATVPVTPVAGGENMLTITATDAQGATGTDQVDLERAPDNLGVLMRPERARYAVGETLNVDIFVAGNATTAYLDVIKGRQTFGLAALPVSQGLAQAAVPLDGSLLGTVELNAYVITDQGTVVRDRRLVLVAPAAAEVTLRTDAQVYRPGDTARLELEVSHDGAPMQSALGISIVDESVFSVGAQEPGFARTYFLLERELLEPRYQIFDFVELPEDAESPYDRERDSLRMVQAEDARELALMGFFGEELAVAHSAAPDAAQSGARPLDPALVGWAYRLALGVPLLGLSLYDGSRRRRNLLILAVLLSLAVFFWGACGSSSTASRTESVSEEATAASSVTEQPRLRQFFPETLYWEPELISDEQGRAQVEIPIADSITTWRVSVVASDREGNLGSAQIGMPVFQDFFVEPDLPRFLTVGDELDLPISLYNYLDEPQSVRLELTGTGFKTLYVFHPTVHVAAHDVTVTYLPIRVTEFGRHSLQVKAIGSRMSDAVLREISVQPDGLRRSHVIGGRLVANQEIPLTIPPDSIPGTAQVTVKIYPGIVSQLVDGLEGLLRQPYGCFEQTSSATYPNVLILNYLRASGQMRPDIQMQAEHYVNLGYQRLLSFETTTPGGFSLFGDLPPQLMLSAYGLMEFSDMSKVSYVDPALLERTAEYLIQAQESDGSWRPEEFTIQAVQAASRKGNVPATAYIVWALADAGYAEHYAVQKAVKYLESNLALLPDESLMEPSRPDVSPLATPEGTPIARDNYTLALVANALISTGRDARQVLDLLLANGLADSEGNRFWRSGLSTWSGSTEGGATIETTALTAAALLRAGYRPDEAQKALDYLTGHRNQDGLFATTQATVLVLKALVLAEELGDKGHDVTALVSLGQEPGQELRITAESQDVMHLIRFEDVAPGENLLAFDVQGEGPLHYQIITEYYMPWATVPDTPEPADALRIDVTYDRTNLQVDDTVRVTAEVELLAAGNAGTVLVDLGVPPGFSPILEDLDGWVEEGLVDRYELTGRQILVYLTDVASGRVYLLEYRLQARFPLRAQVPDSQVYDYYNPQRRDVDGPQRIIVELGTPGK